MGKYSKAYKKVTPFKYPHARHIRTQGPPVFSDYRRYKSYLRKEFKKKCVYCRKPDTMQDQGSFHVEHYRPKKFFPHLENDYSNLLYACANCNRYKSTYWTEEAKKQILNPCIHIMNQYVSFDKEYVVAKDVQGENFIRILRLNSERSVKYRKTLDNLIILLIKTISEVDGASKLQDKRQELSDSIELLSQLTGSDIANIQKALRFS